jgi:hypothetical protein
MTYVHRIRTPMQHGKVSDDGALQLLAIGGTTVQKGLKDSKARRCTRMDARLGERPPYLGRGAGKPSW